jgi:broad specificity phosphatase PhoE
VVVAHGGTLSALLRYVLKIPLEVPRRFRLPNAAFNRFVWESGRWYLETWGDTSHWQTPASSDDLEHAI